MLSGSTVESIMPRLTQVGTLCSVLQIAAAVESLTDRFLQKPIDFQSRGNKVACANRIGIESISMLSVSITLATLNILKMTDSTVFIPLTPKRFRNLLRLL